MRLKMQPRMHPGEPPRMPPTVQLPAERQRTRRAVLAAGTALAGLAVGACAAASSGLKAESVGGVPDRPVTITYLPQGAGAASPFWEKSVAQFKEKHPQVNVVHTPNNGGQNVMEKFLSLSAAGTAPDIVGLNPQYVEPMRARGILVDLTPYINHDAKTFKPEDFIEASTVRVIRNGRWFAIPINMGLWFLIYNTAAFKQVGAPAPDATWTWDRLVDTVHQIMARDANVLGMSMPPYEVPLRDNGGDILTADEKKCRLDEPASVEAFQWMADLRFRLGVVPGPEELGSQAVRQHFDNGRIVVHVADNGFHNTTVRQQTNTAWDIATLPKGKVARVSTAKGPSASIATDSKERDTAWAWLSYYMGPEVEKAQAVEEVTTTARKSGLQAYLDSQKGFNKQALLDVASIAKPIPYVAKYDEIAKEIDDGQTQILSKQQPPRTVLTEVARKVNAILATNS